jgi:hypothetical protein
MTERARHPYSHDRHQVQDREAFPASDPVARFITGLAMISNDWLRSLEEMFKLSDTPEETGRRISLFRQQAALVHEAATFITDARRMFPQVASFLDGLEPTARNGCKRLIAAVDPNSPEYPGEWLEDHRNVTHHYPKMHPEAAKHGWSGGDGLRTGSSRRHREHYR